MHTYAYTLLTLTPSSAHRLLAYHYWLLMEPRVYSLHDSLVTEELSLLH